MKDVLAASIAGALAGAVATLALVGAADLLGSRPAQAAAAPRLEYRIATVDLTAHVVTLGTDTLTYRQTQGLDEMLNATILAGGWRLVDVYTLGTFGPFFVLERPIP